MKFQVEDDDARIIGEWLHVEHADVLECLDIEITDADRTEVDYDVWSDTITVNGQTIRLEVPINGEVMAINDRDECVDDLVERLCELTGHNQAFELWVAVKHERREPTQYRATPETIQRLREVGVEMRRAQDSRDPRRMSDALSAGAMRVLDEANALSRQVIA